MRSPSQSDTRGRAEPRSLAGSVDAFDGCITAGRLRQPTFPPIQLVLDGDEGAIDLTPTSIKQQGFNATDSPDYVNLDTRVVSIHGGKP
jgi:hypothetical protein